MRQGVGVDAEPDVDRPRVIVSSIGETGRAEPGLAGPCPLEVRYRRLLRVLPTGYRAVREGEMVETFLASECAADPENADLTLRLGWPGVREAAGVLALAVRLRWAGVTAPERARVRAGALRIAVLASLTLFAVLAVGNLLDRLWLAVAHPEYGSVPFPGVGSVDALWSTVRDWSFLLWILALVAVLSGRPRWAQLAGAIPLLTTLVAAVAYPWWAGSWPMLVYSLALFFIQVAVLASLSSFDDRVAVAGRRGWIIAAVPAILALSAVTVAAWLSPAAMYPLALALFVDNAGPWCAAAVIAAAVAGPPGPRVAGAHRGDVGGGRAGGRRGGTAVRVPGQLGADPPAGLLADSADPHRHLHPTARRRSSRDSDGNSRCQTVPPVAAGALRPHHLNIDPKPSGHALLPIAPPVPLVMAARSAIGLWNCDPCVFSGWPVSPVQAIVSKCIRSPSARETLMTVARLGLPSADSAL